jgi:hypothetical protein
LISAWRTRARKRWIGRERREFRARIGCGAHFHVGELAGTAAKRGANSRWFAAKRDLIDENGPSSPFRFSNELARHKALDAVGDLALLFGDGGAFVVISSRCAPTWRPSQLDGSMLQKRRISDNLNGGVWLENPLTGV